MQIAPKKAVAIEFTLKDDEGEVLDTSEGREPLTYIHGIGTLVPGLEKALEGKSVGDSIAVTLTPEEAYGPRDERFVRNTPIRKLPEKKAQIGMRYRVDTDEGPLIFMITDIKGDYATVDANHPLAGMTLHFDVKVVEVRDATEEELTHGHIHGPGAHEHGHDHDHDH